jgi:hypothetical protein
LGRDFEGCNLADLAVFEESVRVHDVQQNSGTTGLLEGYLRQDLAAQTAQGLIARIGSLRE